MSGERLELQPFQSSNTSITFAGIKQAGLVYRTSPVEKRESIIIAGLIPVDNPQLIDLSSQLEHDLLVTGISADIINDDSQRLQLDRTNNYSITYAQIILEVLDRNSQIVLRTLSLFLSANTPLSTELIISPKAIYRLRSNLAIRSITIVGKVVYLNTPLVFNLPANVSLPA